MSDIVSVVFGGPSAEHDISILTGLQCERALTKVGTSVRPIYWDRGGAWHLVPNLTEARDYLTGVPRGASRLEFRFGNGSLKCVRAGALGREVLLGSVVLALHGGLGEGGGVQSLFAMMGTPATGSSPSAAALGLDKLAFGALMTQLGIPTLPRELVSDRREPKFDPPYIVKPRFGGSSIGIEVVDEYKTALGLRKASPHLRAGAVIEPYRSDLFDLNIAFMTYPEFGTSLIERPLRSDSGAIYDYAGKYMTAEGLSSSPRELPARISTSLEACIRASTQLIQEATGLSGICRVDFLTDGDVIFANEVNSIPGAMAFYLWPEREPAHLLQGMLDEAERSVADGGASGSYEVGAALRVAGGISAKLAGLGPRAATS